LSAENLKNRLLVHLWKAGDFTNDETNFLQTHGLDSLVTYLGQPDAHTLVQVYNAADVPGTFTLRVCMTVLKQWLVGHPIITANVSLLPEVVEMLLSWLTDGCSSNSRGTMPSQNNPAYREALRTKGWQEPNCLLGR